MVSPKSNDKCPYKIREGEKIYKEEGNVKTEVETGVICLQAKECQGSHQKLVGEGMEQILPQSLQKEPTLLISLHFRLLVSRTLRE